VAVLISFVFSERFHSYGHPIHPGPRHRRVGFGRRDTASGEQDRRRAVIAIIPTWWSV
jgi:siderophore synthetase component